MMDKIKELEKYIKENTKHPRNLEVSYYGDIGLIIKITDRSALISQRLLNKLEEKYDMIWVSQDGLVVAI